MYEELNDYLYTADTLDRDSAMAMTPEEFAAEMQRMRNVRALDARVTRRRLAHRRALKAGAARLVRRSLNDDEPTLSDLGADDMPQLFHHSVDRDAAERKAVAASRLPILDTAAVQALGVYLDLVSVGEVENPALDYERTRARLVDYLRQHAGEPAVLAQRNTSTTLAILTEAV